jgi:hypothetical protein
MTCCKCNSVSKVLKALFADIFFLSPFTHTHTHTHTKQPIKRAIWTRLSLILFLYTHKYGPTLPSSLALSLSLSLSFSLSVSLTLTYTHKHSRTYYFSFSFTLFLLSLSLNFFPSLLLSFLYLSLSPLSLSLSLPSSKLRTFSQTHPINISSQQMDTTFYLLLTNRKTERQKDRIQKDR